MNRNKNNKLTENGVILFIYICFIVWVISTYTAMINMNKLIFPIVNVNHISFEHSVKELENVISVWLLINNLFLIILLIRIRDVINSINYIYKLRDKRYEYLCSNVIFMKTYDIGLRYPKSRNTSTFEIGSGSNIILGQMQWASRELFLLSKSCNEPVIRLIHFYVT